MAESSQSRTDRLYQQALLLQEKKKVKAAELDRECTFSPKLVTSSKRPTSASAEGAASKGTRFARLYAQAEVTKGKLEAVRAQPDPECTFKPTLAAKSPTSHLRSSGQVFDSLYAKAIAQQQKLEERRKTAGLQDCTFAPALNPDRRKSTPREVPAGESKDSEISPASSRKLYNPEWWSKRLAPESNDPDSRDAVECTFKPKLVAKPVSGTPQRAESGLAGKAVFDKLFSDAEKLESRRQAKQASMTQAKEADCTFTPDLSLTKDVLEGHSMNVGTAHERLYRQALELNQKRSTRPDPAEEGCTFSPSISLASRQLSKALRRTSGTDRLHEMYAEGLLRQKQRAAETSNRSLETSKDDDENCTFTPAITAWPGLEAQMPVHERLYSNAFSRTQSRMVPEEDVDHVLAGTEAPPVAVDGSRRYVQGGELYLI